jgi:hypothetical protein
VRRTSTEGRYPGGYCNSHCDNLQQFVVTLPRKCSAEILALIQSVTKRTQMGKSCMSIFILLKFGNESLHFMYPTALYRVGHNSLDTSI